MPHSCTGKNSRFCSYHAQKEAQARATEKLGKDLAYFFSGNYLSACDLSTALSRLIPAVVRGDVKPKTARTVAYLLQTLLQAIHISQHEYINAFGTDGWRKSVRTSVNSNQDYLFPPTPESEQPEHFATPTDLPHAPSELRTNLRHESPQPYTQPVQPQQPASAPPSNPPQPTATPSHLANATLQQPAETPASCHSERREEPAFSHSPNPTPTPAQAPQTPDRIPETQLIRPVASAPRPNIPPRTLPPASQPAPNRHTQALHFGQSYRLRTDGKPF